MTSQPNTQSRHDVRTSNSSSVENTPGSSAKAAGGNVFQHSIETPRYVPYLMLCCLMSGLALALVIGVMVFVPMLIDAKVEARMAEVKAIAGRGQQDARIALDKVEQTQVQLGAKGIVFPSTH